VRAPEQEERQSTNRVHAAQISTRIVRGRDEDGPDADFCRARGADVDLRDRSWRIAVADSRASTSEVCKEQRLHDVLQRRARHFIAY
jgi:hypothetical protein